MADLANILFSKYHRAILGLLLVRTDSDFHIRDIARITGLQAGTLQRQLKRLEAAGLLRSERIGNQVRYQADQRCPVFSDLASFFRKTSGLAGRLEVALRPLVGKIDAAVVFGSVARSDARPNSDIDVLVVGDADLRSVVSCLAPLVGDLGRDINPVVMTTSKFRRARDTGDVLISRIVKEPRLKVAGDLDELG